ncbi:GNAT family N-acetyltransferase [Salegentibacter agarivorans]
MEIREASEKEIPEILDVLRASLGEVSSHKTESVWRFKHIDNPFGKSLVLLAISEDRIIGVRAFMRWKWQIGNNVYSAFRAVDTATHPDFQGKGIFKKLTLKALDIAEKNGDHFVFNTPNSFSKPGYLKMGWKEISKLKIYIKPVNPIHWKFSENIQSSTEVKFKDVDSQLIEDYNTTLVNRNELFTPKSLGYLKWRYHNNPLQSYKILSKEGFFMAGYVKKHKNLREFRVSELIFSANFDLKNIKKELNYIAQLYGVQFISYKTPEKFSGIGISGNFGPILTFKKINLDKNDEDKFTELKNWQYSLGDMELF